MFHWALIAPLTLGQNLPIIYTSLHLFLWMSGSIKIFRKQSSSLKDTHRENAPSNKTLTTSTNMGIWVINTA